MQTRKGVAPPEMIRQDFAVLDARETLRTTWPNEQLILMQSVLGHCHEGHGVFRGHAYPNTTMDHVVRALRLDPAVIKRDRQSLIDAVWAFCRTTVSGAAPPSLADEAGEPLLGISTLRYFHVDAWDVVRGVYLGGLRDDVDIRRQVEAERHVRIGGGRCYLVDTRRMEEMGLNADELAHGEWEAQIEAFRRDGLIVGEDRREEPEVVWQYIRHRKGPGASDDAAIVAAGLKWGLGVAVGVFLADAIDTLEKYVPVYSDQDRDLAEEIEAHSDGLGLGRTEAELLTFLAAIPEDQQGAVPDSSLRHLLAIDRHRDLCALEAHLLHVEGVPAPALAIGHERISSRRFYEYVEARLRAA
ncbi:MAG: hypothetical protein ACP5VE_13485 [Chthonomonadales bacterium]